MSLLSAYIKTEPMASDAVVSIKALTLYGVWNLDFFHMSFKSLCLHPSISTLQVISLDYLIAFYPLLLIFITYLLVKLHDQSIVVQSFWKSMAQIFVWSCFHM